MPMASVMATRYEVFGSCVEEIDVSVEIENSEVWLCCGWNYLGFIFWRDSGSNLAVEVGDGARYWSAFLMLWA